MLDTIWTRSIVTYISLAVIPLLVVGLLVGWQSYRLQRQQALLLQQEVAQRVATEIRTFIQNIEDDLSLLTKLQHIQNWQGELGEDALAELQAYKDVFETLILFDKDGQEIVRSSRLQTADTDEDKQVRLNEFLQVLEKGSIEYSPPRINSTTGEPIMTIALPMIDLRDGLVNQVLVADIRFRRVWNLIRDIEVSQGSNVYVVGERSQVIAHRDTSIVLQEKIFFVPTVDDIYSGLDETTVILASEKISFGDQTFTVVAERTTTDALSLANRSLMILIIGILIAAAAAVRIGIILARRMTEPIQALANTAQAISAGDLSQRAVSSEFQELTDLSNAFNAMSTQLRDSITTLEEQVRHRTHDLTVSMEISRQITLIKDLESLLAYVVDRIQTGYSFYHTQIYLVDPEGEYLILAEGYGDVGRMLKTRNHRLRVDEGIVGTVYTIKDHFVSNNVEDLINFVKNPLLPFTKSELSVPLRSGDQILGVLDIQSQQFDRFNAEEVTLFQSLADQTAIAITNIRLLEETQAHLLEVERLNKRLTREGWNTFAQDTQTFGYRYHRGQSWAINTAGDTVLIDRPSLPAQTPFSQAKPLLVNNQLGSKRGRNGSGKHDLSIPLVLRGEVVGLLDVKRDKRPIWTDEEQDVVTRVADQLVRALDNVRLSKEQEKTIVQLQEIDRLKSEFLTSMSHELRTPLNSIIGFADILLQGIDGDLNDLMVTDVTAIYNSGRHLLELINGILDLSKIEAGRLELNCDKVDVFDAFTHTLSSVSSLLLEKPVDLIIDAEPDLPNIWADPLRFNQILLNLVSNAIKFTNEGTVTMRANIKSDNFIEITIKDTGVGIPDDKLEIVFDRFRQVDSSNNRRYQGTGMGLAISKQLTELHGGQMWLESKFGQGTTFFFTMPITSDEVVAEN